MTTETLLYDAIFGIINYDAIEEFENYDPIVGITCNDVHYDERAGSSFE